mmetsp:Transcript_2961/g.6918  ORF Transcript_2961/g.6918 Transcript_2961/m.6918 type:complete len:117 (+) Transcript_2961:144-494(+)
MLVNNNSAFQSVQPLTSSVIKYPNSVDTVSAMSISRNVTEKIRDLSNQRILTTPTKFDDFGFLARNDRWGAILLKIQLILSSAELIWGWNPWDVPRENKFLIGFLKLMYLIDSIVP